MAQRATRQRLLVHSDPNTNHLIIPYLTACHKLYFLCHNTSKGCGHLVIFAKPIDEFLLVIKEFVVLILTVLQQSSIYFRQSCLEVLLLLARSVKCHLAFSLQEVIKLL